MRKIAGFFVCWLTVFTLTHYLLNSGLEICVRWLTPVLGPELRVAAIAFQALFSSPFKYPEALAIWVVAGLATGLVVGRKLGAALTAAVAFLFILLILVSSGLNMLLALEEEPLSAEELPPIPQARQSIRLSGYRSRKISWRQSQASSTWLRERL